jgi:hypothetical protein
VSGRKYSFEKETQFSEGINGVDAASSNIDGFVRRNTCVSSTQLNRPFWSNMSHNPLETFHLQELFLSKTESVLKEQQCARCCTI